MAYSKEKIIQIGEYFQKHGEEKTLSDFQLKSETLNRLIRYYKQFDNNFEINSTLQKIKERYTEKELQSLVSGVRIVPGQVKVPIINFGGDKYKIGYFTDSHMGSIYFKESYWEQMLEQFKQEKVDMVVCSGDITHGMNHHQDLIYELIHIGYDAQKEYAVKMLSMLEWPFKCINGNHDRWYIKGNGANIVKDICKDLKHIHKKDAEWLGHDEGDISFNGHAVLKLWHGEDGNSYATSYRLQKIVECVPLDTEILTKEGWKKHDQIKIGEEILGYNVNTKKCEWNRLLKVNYNYNSEVVTYKNDNFKVRVTRNHKWAMSIEHRAGKNKHSINPTAYKKFNYGLFTIDETKDDWKRARIIQAAISPDGEGIKIENHLDWIDRKNAEKKVLQMTSSERKAFILGMLYGEGTLAKSQKDVSKRKGSIVFSQNPGYVNEAFKLACFLEGISVGSTRKITKKFNGDIKINGRTTMLIKPVRMINSIQEVNSKIEDTWCPTTELHTWVMKQGDTITITGNSFTGGEKPHILLTGHTHKQGYFMIRFVHVVSGGAMSVQSHWMRSKKIENHTGFWIIEFTVNKSGVARFKPEWYPFYA